MKARHRAETATAVVAASAEHIAPVIAAGTAAPRTDAAAADAAAQDAAAARIEDVAAAVGNDVPLIQSLLLECLVFLVVLHPLLFRVLWGGGGRFASIGVPRVVRCP